MLLSVPLLSQNSQSYSIDNHMCFSLCLLFISQDLLSFELLDINIVQELESVPNNTPAGKKGCSWCISCWVVGSETQLALDIRLLLLVTASTCCSLKGTDSSSVSCLNVLSLSVFSPSRHDSLHVSSASRGPPAGQEQSLFGSDPGRDRSYQQHHG